jgi:hypothetical protein
MGFMRGVGMFERLGELKIMYHPFFFFLVSIHREGNCLRKRGERQNSSVLSLLISSPHLHFFGSTSTVDSEVYSRFHKSLGFPFRRIFLTTLVCQVFSVHSSKKIFRAIRSSQFRVVQASLHFGMLWVAANLAS